MYKRKKYNDKMIELRSDIPNLHLPIGRDCECNNVNQLCTD